MTPILWKSRAIALVNQINRIPDSSYKSIPEQEKTQKKGRGYGPLYGSKSIDFNHLKSFVESRSGQTIVAEGEGANWLDFRLLEEKKSAGKDYREAVYVCSGSAQGDAEKREAISIDLETIQETIDVSMESPVPPAGAIAAKGPLKRRREPVFDDETDF